MPRSKKTVENVDTVANSKKIAKRARKPKESKSTNEDQWLNILSNRKVSATPKPSGRPATKITQAKKMGAKEVRAPLRKKTVQSGKPQSFSNQKLRDWVAKYAESQKPVKYREKL